MLQIDMKHSLYSWFEPLRGIGVGGGGGGLTLNPQHHSQAVVHYRQLFECVKEQPQTVNYATVIVTYNFGLKKLLVPEQGEMFALRTQNAEIVCLFPE